MTDDDAQRSETSEGPADESAASTEEEQVTAEDGSVDGSATSSEATEEPSEATSEETGEEPTAEAGEGSTEAEELATPPDAVEEHTTADPARVWAIRAAGLTAGVGVLLFWAPVLLTGTGMAMLIPLFAGLVIAVVASASVIKGGEDTISALALPGLIAVLGIVVAASGFVLDLGSENLRIASGVLGALIVLLAVLTVYGYRKADRRGAGAAVAS